MPSSFNSTTTDVGEAAEDLLEAVGQGMEMLQVECGERLAVFAGLLHGFLERALAGTPADEQHVAFAGAVNLRHGQFLGEFAELVAPLGVHLRVQLAGAGRMAQLVVLQAGDDRILATGDAGAGRNMAGDAVGGREIVRLVIGDRRKVRRDILADLLKVGTGKGLDARGDALVGEQHDGRGVFAGDIHGFDRRVEAILDAGRCEHHAGTVAMAAEDGDVQVALLDAGRHPRARAAALHVDDDDWHFRHAGPAERLGLERDARTARTRDGDAPAVAGANGHRDGGDFILGLHERTSIFGQFAPEQFHDVAPRRDRVAGSEAHAGGEQPIGERFIAAHDDCECPAFSPGWNWKVSKRPCTW